MKTLPYSITIAATDLPRVFVLCLCLLCVCVCFCVYFFVFAPEGIGVPDQEKGPRPAGGAAADAGVPARKRTLSFFGDIRERYFVLFLFFIVVCIRTPDKTILRAARGLKGSIIPSLQCSVSPSIFIDVLLGHALALSAVRGTVISSQIVEL